MLVSQLPNTIARTVGAVYEILDYGHGRFTTVLRSGRNGHVYGQVLTNRIGFRPVADVDRSCEVLNQRAMGPQLRQPRRDGGHNVMTRHVSRMSFVQAIGDPIDRRRWYCPPVMSPARPERRRLVIIALGPSSTSTHVIQVIVVAECGSELSQIWTVSDGIPNPDLKVSGELSAMCSTEQAVTERGVSFAGAPPLPESRPGSSCTRPPETPLHTEVFGPEDSDPIAGSPVEVRISHQDHPQPQSLFGCRHLVLVTTTRRVTAEARLHPAPVSPVPVNSGGRGLACATTRTGGARRARMITWVAGDGDYAALSLGDVSGAHDVPVRAVEERRWCSSREVTACWRRKFSLRLPLALPGDVSS